MRGMVLLMMFSVTLVDAAWNDYVEVRDLRLDAADIDELFIDAGAGSLLVTGNADAEEIVVAATITIPGADAEKAREIIESDMVLSLERRDERAVLDSRFDSGLWDWGDAPGIALEVRMPTRLGLAIDDGSGSIEVRDVRGDVAIDDGSGSLVLIRVGGTVEVDDGSGSLSVQDAGGDVRIVDGSGSITVTRVAGSVFIDDGSGGIDVSDVQNDLIIEEDGSGGVRIARVTGRIENDN